MGLVQMAPTVTYLGDVTQKKLKKTTELITPLLPHLLLTALMDIYEDSGMCWINSTIETFFLQRRLHISS